MKQFLKCIPCYLNACANALEKTGLSESERQRALCAVLPTLAALPADGTPCENASALLHALYEKLPAGDPFAGEKKRSNDLAASYLGRLEQILDDAGDRLYTALKLAAAGNIIDLAIFESVDLEPAIRHCLQNDFAIDGYLQFKRKLKTAKNVLIVGDNAGEIVFDTLLARELQSAGCDVSYMVKSGCIVNDATAADAEYAGMARYARVIDTGRADMGYSFKTCPRETSEFIKSRDVIISKGQANFEGFESARFLSGKIFFLFKVKCAAISSFTGAPLGAVVFIPMEELR